MDVLLIQHDLLHFITKIEPATGRGVLLLGVFEAPVSKDPGSVITVLEDVVTTGGSSLKAVDQLRKAGYRVQRVVTIVDREEGGAAAMAAADLELISLFRLSEISAFAQGLTA